MTTNSSTYKFNAMEDFATPVTIDFEIGQVTFYTHKMQEKEKNEDHIAISTLKPNHLVLTVADGAGGHRGGSKASEIAASNMYNLKPEQAGKEFQIQLIYKTIESANQEIISLGVGAATTLAAVEIINDNFRTYHAGDSEILLFGGKGKLKYRTVSHSPLGLAEEAGLMSDVSQEDEEQYKLEVTNMLGDPKLKVEISSEMKLSKQDTLIIASDGLIDNLSIETIATIASKGNSIQVCKKLLAETNAVMESQKENSKPDDLSIIVFKPRIK